MQFKPSECLIYATPCYTLYNNCHSFYVSWFHWKTLLSWYLFKSLNILKEELGSMIFLWLKSGLESKSIKELVQIETKASSSNTRHSFLLSFSVVSLSNVSITKNRTSYLYFHLGSLSSFSCTLYCYPTMLRVCSVQFFVAWIPPLICYLLWTRESLR